MIYYICKRCNYKTNFFNNIKRHINNNNICTTHFSSYNLSNEDILIYSLIPYINDKQSIDKINYYDKDDKIIVNKQQIFEILSEIDNNKLKICKYCNNSFKKTIDLKKHILINCKICINLNDTKNVCNITNNTYNNCNINNNNITINFEIKPIISFDEKWDISHLSDSLRQSIFMSSYKYTQFIEHILQNDKNLNVLFDKNNEKATVFLNNKFKEMNKDNIVDESMVKIHTQLLDIYNDIKSNNKYALNELYLENEKKTTDVKLNEYNLDNKLRNNIIPCIVNIFTKHNEEIIEKYKNINEKIEL